LEEEPPIRFLFQALIAATSDSNIPTKITTNPSPSRNNKQEEEEEEEEETDLSLEAEDLQKRKKKNQQNLKKETNTFKKNKRGKKRKEKVPTDCSHSPAQCVNSSRSNTVSCYRQNSS
jgi:uncharacterized protein with gpF-like domain